VKLAELNPKIENDVLVFDCPCGAAHRLRVPVRRYENHKGVWNLKGSSFADYTLAPSIRVPCWHGEITAGAIVTKE